jgi:membrane associated rhomboid family serine protease
MESCARATIPCEFGRSLRGSAGHLVQAPHTAWIEVSRAPARKTVHEHGLVLQAVGIVSGMVFADGAHVLIVRAEDLERAREELEKYARENRGWPPREEAPPVMSQGINAAIVYGGILALCYIAQTRESYGIDWWSAGSASAARIHQGEWWRAVTALCLHGDFLHLAGNIVFGALFGVILAQSVGSGMAWLTFVITGGMGNWLNAWVQEPSHTSIGASTAVFGMLGVQVTYEWMRRRELSYNRLRRYAPFVAGAALLAWLGGGGQSIDPHEMPDKLDDLNAAIQKIDVWAHVLGFAAGLVLGAILGVVKKKITPAARGQFGLAAIAAGVVVLAWVLAVRA